MGIYLRHNCTKCKLWRRSPGQCKCGGTYAPSFYVVTYKVGKKNKTEKAGTLAKARTIKSLREKQPHQSQKTIKEVSELYFKTKSLTTQQVELQYWKHLKVFEPVRLCDLTRGDVLEYLSRRKEEKNKHGRINKNSSLEREIAILRGVWQYAYGEGWVQNNPFLKLGLSQNHLEPINKYLTLDEWQLLYEHLPEVTRDYYYFLWQTAARSKEASNLTWKDIDLNMKLAWITGKGKGREVLYLSDPVCEMLKARPRHDTVFVNRYGEKLKYPRMVLKDTAEACGLNDTLEKTGRGKITGTHYLRHAAISRWIMQGNDLAVVSGLARHTTIQMTMRYIHLAPEKFHAAVNIKE